MGTNLSESDFGDEVGSHDNKDVDSVLVDGLPVEAVTEEAPEQGRNNKCLNRGLKFLSYQMFYLDNCDLRELVVIFLECCAVFIRHEIHD